MPSALSKQPAALSCFSVSQVGVAQLAAFRADDSSLRIGERPPQRNCAMASDMHPTVTNELPSIS